MILVIYSIRRIRQDQIRRFSWNFGEELKTATAVNLIGKISVYRKRGGIREVWLPGHHADSLNFVLMMRYRFVAFGK